MPFGESTLDRSASFVAHIGSRADLDDDELDHLAHWLASAPLISGQIDLRRASAWRCTEARIAVENREATSFREVGE